MENTQLVRSEIESKAASTASTSPAAESALPCPLESTLDVLAGRWRVLIVRELLFKGELRFGELQRGLPGVSQRMLIRELRGLVLHGIVARNDFQENPPRVSYALTAKGQSLAPVLSVMSRWATEHHLPS